MVRMPVVRRTISALLLGGIFLIAPFQTAQAARQRPIVVRDRVPNPTPSTPEPAAAIVFGLGVALVAWRSRNSRSPK